MYKIAAVTVVATSLTMLSSVVRADYTQAIVSGHTDMGVLIENGVLVPHIHAHAGVVGDPILVYPVGETELELSNLTTYYQVNANHKTTITNATVGSLLGSGTGSFYWKLPTNGQTGKQYIGMGAEDIIPDQIDNYSVTDSRVADIYGSNIGPWIKWTLEEITGPGQYAMWTGSTGVDTSWISTSDGLTADDAFYMQAGGHEHVNMGFTLPGTYDLKFLISTQAGGQVISSEGVYHFVVADVPEPASLSLGALGFWGLTLRRKK